MLWTEVDAALTVNLRIVKTDALAMDTAAVFLPT